MADKQPSFPLFLRAKDIAQIENCSLRTAERRLTQDKKELGLGRNVRLSIYAYCKKHQVAIDQVIPRYLQILIFLAAISIASAFCKMALDYSCEYFRKHKMHIEEATPTHLKEHTFYYDPQTKRMEKMTITIDKIK